MTSPFASRLGTNYCPLDEEASEIQRLLKEPLSRLKGIDDKIAELQKAIDELTEEHRSVSTYVEAHKALLSPLRRLPLDIIQEIFVACLPTHRNCVMSAVEAPMLLGRICSSWRALSLSTPRLWARLHIAEPDPPGHWQTPIYAAQYTQRIANTITWLGRSGICPLSISLEGSQYPEPSAVSPFLEVILSQASRWRHIAITAASSVALNTVFSLTDNDVPMLETLEIEQTQSYSRSPSIENVSLKLLRGPKISSVALTTSEINLVALPLRWENLTSLRLANQRAGPLLPLLTREAALQILSKCPRLRSCQLRLADDLLAPVLEETILELPHLRALNITCVGLTIFSPGGFFSRVSLPELRSLRFSCGTHTRHDDPFFPFLTVSPRLECLQLKWNLISTSVVLDLLSMLPPTIRRLLFALPPSPTRLNRPGRTINRPSPFEDTALKALTPSLDHPAVSCPVLEELEIDPVVDLSDHALLQFIKARMAVESPTLRCVAIQFQREKQFDVHPEIQAFSDSGLQVFTRYFEPSSVAVFSPWRGVADRPPSHTPLS
ncbi:hypothetical protein B0H16DRAFT_1354385 [Mycena metata]|uniref:F-box domain-containing protein n=1 Tax=Mycena metata TaxID=1033252 RepID=A0AAD7KH38_9AGAR|nr:hypothetical protein B0H16DRAFT_1354385 [Mycena metata]